MLKAIAVFAAGVALSAAGHAQASAGSSPPTIEVELAFDMTWSMRDSVDAAKEESRRVISEIRQLDSGATFSVAYFRDYANPVGDYELLQPLTVDLGQIERALGRLRAAGNGTAHNGAAESYSLLFNKSYTDQQVGWQSQSRKLVVVFGDAEPYGAGSAGLSGCRDTKGDPYGLNVAHELDAMRAAGRTLMMVRISSSWTTVSAECYRSIVERVNGGSSDGGTQAGGGTTGTSASPGTGASNPATFDLGKGKADTARIADTLELVRLKLGVEPNSIVRRGRFGVSIQIRNPNKFAIEVKRLALLVPAATSYQPGSLTGSLREPEQAGRAVVWNRLLTLGPGERRAVHLVLATRSGAGRRVLALRADVGLPSGAVLAVQRARFAVVKSLRTLSFAARGETRDRVRVTMRGTAAVGRGLKGRARPGHIVVTMRGGRRVELSASVARIVSLGPRTVLRMPVVITKAKGLRGCVPGSRGYALVRSSKRLDERDRTADTIVIALSGCKSVGRRWTSRTTRTVSVALRVA